MKEPKAGQQKLKLEWNIIVMTADKLIKGIKKSKLKFKNIYGIPRGGMITAVLLSHRLNLPIVEKREISTETLIVDDIVDSGVTMNNFSKEFELQHKAKPTFAALLQRYNASCSISLIGGIIKHDMWIVFPYEVK
ncbi:hypothetical protein CMI37_39320 [Candidatus Pacearchaeota archaeon]|nr:hypothetical protein [Candidatus Pacearchaeota archaeon]|tara:strand:+ start:6695 stop:7099 length:405 start_codon:yes stop_codon:yes gene_type:complete